MLCGVGEFIQLFGMIAAVNDLAGGSNTDLQNAAIAFCVINWIYQFLFVAMIANHCLQDSETRPPFDWHECREAFRFSWLYLIFGCCCDGSLTEEERHFSHEQRHFFYLVI